MFQVNKAVTFSLISVELCKEAWRKIKLAYQNSQRHARSKVNADGSIRKPYYLHKQMEFYEPHLRARDMMNQLVKVDQQAAQQWNQKLHQTMPNNSSIQDLTSNYVKSVKSPDSDKKSPTSSLDQQILGLYKSEPSWSSLPSERSSPSQPITSQQSLPFLSSFGLEHENESVLNLTVGSKRGNATENKSQVLKRRQSSSPDSTFEDRKEKLFLKRMKHESHEETKFFTSFLGNSVNVENLDNHSAILPLPRGPLTSQVTDLLPPLDLDPDLQFLLSLHASIKCLNLRQKFGFKRRVYAIMEEILDAKD